MGRMKKAKWKSREEHNDYIHAECSGCGFQVESYDAVETGRSSTEYIKAKWKFCPEVRSFNDSVEQTERSQPPAGAKEKNEKYQRKQFLEKRVKQ